MGPILTLSKSKILLDPFQLTPRLMLGGFGLIFFLLKYWVYLVITDSLRAIMRKYHYGYTWNISFQVHIYLLKKGVFLVHPFVHIGVEVGNLYSLEGSKRLVTFIH